jgi:cell wall assembly regulator SMI1
MIRESKWANAQRRMQELPHTLFARHEQGQISILEYQMDASFHNPVRWTLFVDRKPYFESGAYLNLFICQSIADHAYENLARSYPQPPFENSIVLVRGTNSDSEVSDLMRQGKAVQIPMTGPHTPYQVIDGSRHSVMFRWENGSLSLSWTSANRADFRSLQIWLKDLRAAFERALHGIPFVDDPRDDACALYELWKRQISASRIEFQSDTYANCTTEDLTEFEQKIAHHLAENVRNLWSRSGASRVFAPDGLLFDLHTPEKILELREDATIPRTIHDTPIIPFASDERGVLLLELTDAGAVWRWHDGNVQQVADTLTKYFIDLLHKWQRTYSYSAW